MHWLVNLSIMFGVVLFMALLVLALFSTNHNPFNPKEKDDEPE